MSRSPPPPLPSSLDPVFSLDSLRSMVAVVEAGYNPFNQQGEVIHNGVIGGSGKGSAKEGNDVGYLQQREHPSASVYESTSSSSSASVTRPSSSSQVARPTSFADLIRAKRESEQKRAEEAAEKIKESGRKIGGGSAKLGHRSEPSLAAVTRPTPSPPPPPLHQTQTTTSIQTTDECIVPPPPPPPPEEDEELPPPPPPPPACEEEPSAAIENITVEPPSNNGIGVRIDPTSSPSPFLTPSNPPSASSSPSPRLTTLTDSPSASLPKPTASRLPSDSTINNPTNVIDTSASLTSLAHLASTQQRAMVSLLPPPSPSGLIIPPQDLAAKTAALNHMLIERELASTKIKKLMPKHASTVIGEQALQEAELILFEFFGHTKRSRKPKKKVDQVELTEIQKRKKDLQSKAEVNHVLRELVSARPRKSSATKPPPQPHPSPSSEPPTPTMLSPPSNTSSHIAAALTAAPVEVTPIPSQTVPADSPKSATASPLPYPQHRTPSPRPYPQPRTPVSFRSTTNTPPPPATPKSASATSSKSSATPPPPPSLFEDEDYDYDEDYEFGSDAVMVLWDENDPMYQQQPSTPSIAGSAARRAMQYVQSPFAADHATPLTILNDDDGELERTLQEHQAKKQLEQQARNTPTPTRMNYTPSPTPSTITRLAKSASHPLAMQIDSTPTETQPAPQTSRPIEDAITTTTTTTTATTTASSSSRPTLSTSASSSSSSSANIVNPYKASLSLKPPPIPTSIPSPLPSPSASSSSRVPPPPPPSTSTSFSLLSSNPSTPAAKSSASASTSSLPTQLSSKAHALIHGKSLRQQRPLDLLSMLRTNIGYRFMLIQCYREYSEENVLAFKAIESFTKHPTLMSLQAFVNKYIAPAADLMINISSATNRQIMDSLKEHQLRDDMKKNKVTPIPDPAIPLIDVLQAAHKEIINLLERDSFKRFKASLLYVAYVSGIAPPTILKRAGEVDDQEDMQLIEKGDRLFNHMGEPIAKKK